MLSNPLKSLDDYSRFINENRLFWYDDFPHPNDSTLASTFPHHKHVPPDIKHNRIPAPNMSFTWPNLPALLQEITELIENLNGKGKVSP